MPLDGFLKIHTIIELIPFDDNIKRAQKIFKAKIDIKGMHG